MLEKVTTFVIGSFGKENPHHARTLYWIEQLKPDCGEELRIAAYSHDIERAFDPEAKEKKEFNTAEEMKKHQTEGGKIMYEFLTKEGYDNERAARVRNLISCHEVGGDEEQNLLKDADSISWLEVSAPKHISRKTFSKEELSKKIESMFSRISSEEAREMAKPFYEEDLKMLDKM